MKLRNKKTGEIWDIGKVLVNDYPCWETLTQICEDWEDVKEPLIKDEKIRKAVRAWAEADGADEKIYLTIDENGSRFANKYGGYIEFGFQVDMDEGLFTIDELCGEGEE